MAHKKDLRDKPVTMTHQHFRFIARVLRENRMTQFAETFAAELAKTNPKFNKERFIEAVKA